MSGFGVKKGGFLNSVTSLGWHRLLSTIYVEALAMIVEDKICGITEALGKACKRRCARSG
jgi:hypothetical protein